MFFLRAQKAAGSVSLVLSPEAFLDGVQPEQTGGDNGKLFGFLDFRFQKNTQDLSGVSALYSDATQNKKFL